MSRQQSGSDGFSKAVAEPGSKRHLQKAQAVVRRSAQANVRECKALQNQVCSPRQEKALV
jgi:hypothetical protein